VSDADCRAIAAALQEGIDAVATTGDYIVVNYPSQVREVAAGAVPFLELLGIVAGGWQMARAALAASAKVGAGGTASFHAAKLKTARFYAEHVLIDAPKLAREICAGGASVLALETAQL